MTFGPDRYTRIARIKPALLVVLPAALAVLAWFPDAKLGTVWALVVTCGGTYLMALVARARGKAKEAELFEKFGGHPTIKRLKQLDTPNTVSLQRWRRRIQELLPDQPLPTAEEERRDPDGTYRVYASIMRFLIERTRDKEKFALLFEENCQYGFARNLWAMKPVGLTISMLSLAATAFVAYEQNAAGRVEPLTWVAIAGSVLMAIAWLFWITPRLVQVPSEAYADRLLAALDVL